MKYLLQVFLLCFLINPVFADLNSQQDSQQNHPCMFSDKSLCVSTSSRPDAHAPIGVMGDHNHKQGEWMVSSRLMFMKMGHPSSHKNKMNRGMFVPSVMYGVTDKFTVIAMIPYMYSITGHGRKRGGKGRDGKRGHRADRGDRKDHEMTIHEKESGGSRMSRHGVGDISLTGLYSLSEGESYKSLLTFGLLASPKELKGRDAYGVQGAFVFVNYWTKYSIGTQFGLKGGLYTRLLTGEGFFNLWGAYILSENTSLSARVKYEYLSQKISEDIQKAFFYVGGNLIGTDFAEGHRLALEVGTSFNNPALIALLGWQKTF